MNNNFLKYIEFKENFPPFRKGTKITFEKDGMQDIIKFYLMDKKGFTEVAERMKINVVVGENGTGKSRLLNMIYNRDKGNYIKTNLENMKIIIDNPTIFENVNINNNFYDLFFGIKSEENKSFRKEILNSFLKLYTKKLILKQHLNQFILL